MEKQESVSIEAGDRLEFKHGSYHLMLMDLPEPLKENDLVDIILVTSIGEMLIEMPIRKPGMSKHADEKASEHADMKDEHTNMKTNEPSTEQADLKKDGAMHTQQTKTVH